jgi:energy-coupling factor transporter ATP-binding protein EcfA2
LYNKITAKNYNKLDVVSGELAGGRRVLTDGQNGELVVAVVLAEDDDLVRVDEDHLGLDGGRRRGLC